MTHEQVVERAARWLKNTRRCGIVLTEFHSASQEIPDAIGWRGASNSILVEAKVSRSDFYADRKKPGRAGRLAMAGMGRERWYMAPKGILSVELVTKHQPAWGLLEICGRAVRVRKKPIPYGHESRCREMPILYSYVRRVHQYGLSLDEVQSLLWKHSGRP